MVPGRHLIHFIKCLLDKTETLGLIASMVGNNNKTQADILVYVSNLGTREVEAGIRVQGLPSVILPAPCTEVLSSLLWASVHLGGEKSYFSY